MPRILRIINRLNLGGPTYNVAYLTKYLAPDFETMLVAGTKLEDEESSEFILDKLAVKPVLVSEMKREINPLADYRAYTEIKKLIKFFRPDIVHTHAAKSGTLGRLAAINCKVPVIVHTFHGHVFHSYFNPVKTKIFLSIEKYLAKKCSSIVAISDLQKQELCSIHKVCSENKTVVIPLGFDLSRFRENTLAKRMLFRAKYHLDKESIAVGIIGRFAPVKNHTLFLKAAHTVLKRANYPVVFFLIGDGDNRQLLEQQCRLLQLNFSHERTNENKATVVFTSWIKEIDIALAGMDIVAMTSLNEGTPVSLIEAQASGKPIVSTNVGGIENVVIKNETALLSESGNADAFASNLVKLIEDENLRNKMALLGWKHVKNKFHYTRLVQDMRNLYLKLLLKKQEG